MNKYIRLLLVCLLYASSPGQNAHAQCDGTNNTASPCNGIISTDPTNPANVERYEMRNRFEWRNSTLSVYPFRPSTFADKTNPFFTTFSYLKHINYYSIAGARNTGQLDFHPEDGWELLHRHNGYEPNGVTVASPVVQRDKPYMMLYNRYTGVLRVLSYFEGANQEVVTSLKFKKGVGFNYSALLGAQQYLMPVMSEKTKVTGIEAVSPSPSNGYHVADFNTAYDPCTCQYDSQLEFGFNYVNQSSALLEGRIIGTNVPLNGSGTSPLLNGKDFLLSVAQDNQFSVQGGRLTYSNIDALVARYKTKPGLSALEQAGLNAFGSLLKEGARLLDIVITNQTRTWDPLLDNNLGIAATLTDGLIASITPEKQTIPNISFLEAEGIFRGNIETKTPVWNDEISIMNPGSLNSNASWVGWERYPAYNEVLGLFAVLEKPKVARITIQPIIPCDGGIITDIGPLPCDPIKTYLSYQNNLKYTFNPAAEVNEERTKIYGALIVKTKGQIADANLSFVKSNVAQDTVTYISTIVPLENLHYMIPVFSRSIGAPEIHEVQLKLIIDYEFKPNRYGKINKSIQIATYPVELITGIPNSSGGFSFSDPDFIGIPYEYGLQPIASQLTLNDINFTRDTRIDAKGTITINGNLTVAPGVKVTINSGSNIIVNNTSALNPNIFLTIGYPLPSLSIGSVSSAQVKAFCADNNRYKAREAFSKPSLDLTLDNNNLQMAKVDSLQDKKAALQQSFIAYPNPTNGDVTIAYSLPEKGMVTIWLSDENGQIVKFLVQEGSQDAGNYLASFSTENLPAGVYYYTIQSAGRQETKRLMVVK